MNEMLHSHSIENDINVVRDGEKMSVHYLNDFSVMTNDENSNPQVLEQLNPGALLQNTPNIQQPFQPIAVKKLRNPLGQ